MELLVTLWSFHDIVCPGMLVASIIARCVSRACCFDVSSRDPIIVDVVPTRELVIRFGPDLIHIIVPGFVSVKLSCKSLLCFRCCYRSTFLPALG